MSTDPAAAASFRVPRSEVDSFFLRGEQTPESRVGVGTVVSVDSSNTCTVLINDEEVTGVMWLGTIPPRIGDVVEVEMRGDLLCIPATNDLDTFREGIDESVAHIVSDANPGLPPAVDLQLGGSMRSLDAWAFHGADTLSWTRELSSSGQGLRCFQVGPSVFMARNMVGNPSGEAGLGPDEYGYTWRPATAPGYAGLAAVSVTSETAHSGNVSILAEWAPAPTGDGVELTVIGLTPGDHTVSAWVYVPTGSPDVQLSTTLNGVMASALMPVKDQWTRISFLVTITGPSTNVLIGTAKTTALTGGRCFVDAVMVAPAPPTVAPTYFDGDTVDTLTEQYVWLGTPGLSRSEWWAGAAMPSAVISTNLLPNPSFETNTTGWLAARAALTRVASSTAKSGGYVGHLVNDGTASNHYLLTTPRLPTIPGRLNTCSAWVRLISGSGLGYTARVQYYDASTAPVGGQVSGTAVDLPADGSWVQVSVTTTAPALATLVNLLISTPNAGAESDVWEVDALLAEMSPNLNPYFDGDTPTVPGSAYRWEGTAHASTSTRRTGPIVAQGPSIYGTLWSEESVDVEPGDVVHFEMDLTELYHDTTAQVYVLYGPVEDANPLPTDTDTTQAAQGSAVALAASLTTVSANVTIPATVTFPTTGVAQPRTVKFGVRLAGGSDSQVLALAARGTHTPMGWPLGSQWMNPDAQDGGLPTWADTGLGASGFTSLPIATSGTFYPIPGMKKVVFTAPPGTGGVLEVRATLAVNTVAAAPGTTFEVVWGTATGSGLFGTISRMLTPGITVNTMTATGLIQVAPGDTVDVQPQYRYVTNPATAWSHARGIVQAIFHPGAVLAGTAPMPAPISYWDGDSWRPPALTPGTIDVSKDAAVAAPAKTNTTTTLARSASTIHAGSTLTLTSTTTSGAAGTVTFYRATSASGPWTSLGSATISATKAVKTWTTTAGNWYFKATYSGSATHNTSSSAATAVTTVQKLVTRTVVLACSWAQAYESDGSKLNGTSHDGAVAQGYYSSSSGGNTKTLLRFVHSAIPSAADVTSVVLVCKTGGWDHWYNNSGGTLVVGSFNNQSSVPTSWPSSEVYEDRSRHSVDVGGWSVSLSSWATASLENNDFSGIAIGPGPSNSQSYYGYSASPGSSQFTLKVTYNNWE